MKKNILFLLLSITVSIFSQFRTDVEEFDPRLKLMSPSTGSLFDMSRINIDHSVSMNYSSSGSNSVFINEYVAGINYRISDPMRLRFELGMSYVPYSTFSIPGEDQSADVYLKSASFDYKPNRQFHLHIGFKNYKPQDLLFDPITRPFEPSFINSLNDN